MPVQFRAISFPNRESGHVVLPPNLLKLIAAHPRSFQENRYVYPVLSRRSKGISIGVNLNLDKVCNFDCVYCQVTAPSRAKKSSLISTASPPSWS